jgi:hypothetical protein
LSARGSGSTIVRRTFASTGVSASRVISDSVENTTSTRAGSGVRGDGLRGTKSNAPVPTQRDWSARGGR